MTNNDKKWQKNGLFRPNYDLITKNMASSHGFISFLAKYISLKQVMFCFGQKGDRHAADLAEDRSATDVELKRLTRVHPPISQLVIA